MASYKDEWYIIELNPQNSGILRLYAEDGSTKKYTTESSALEAIQNYFGEDEAILVRKQAITWSVTADS